LLFQVGKRTPPLELSRAVVWAAVPMTVPDPLEAEVSHELDGTGTAERGCGIVNRATRAPELHAGETGQRGIARSLAEMGPVHGESG